MSIFGFFKRPCPQHDPEPTPVDPDLARRQEETQHELELARGDWRNQVQRIQSHSRRVEIMSGALALRNGKHAASDK